MALSPRDSASDLNSASTGMCRAGALCAGRHDEACHPVSVSVTFGGMT